MASDKWERNQSIKNKRQSGAALSELAAEFGMTKERVRQILNKLDGSTEFQNLTRTTMAAKTLGCSVTVIRTLIRDGVINYVRSGNRYLIHSEDLPLLESIVSRRIVKKAERCEVCGGSMPAKRRKYCSDHCMWREHHRRTMSNPERAKRQHLLVRKWQKEHKERFAEITRRAYAKYRQKKLLLKQEGSHILTA